MQKKFYENNLKVLLSFQSLVFHNMHRGIPSWNGQERTRHSECYEILFDEGNIEGFRENVQQEMWVRGNYFFVGSLSKTILWLEISEQNYSWTKTMGVAPHCKPTSCCPPPLQIKRSQWPHKFGARSCKWKICVLNLPFLHLNWHKDIWIQFSHCVQGIPETFICKGFNL